MQPGQAFAAQVSSASFGKFDRIAPNEANRHALFAVELSLQREATNLQPKRKKGIAPVNSGAEKEPLDQSRQGSAAQFDLSSRTATSKP